MRNVIRSLHVVLDPGSWRRLKLAVVLSLTVAAAELAGLALVVPLLEVATTPEGEAVRLPGPLQDWFGDRDQGDLLLLFTLGIFLAFVAKAGLTLIIRWWMFGFITRAEANTATRLLDTYLHAPYSFHLQRNTAELQRNVHNAVRILFERTITQFITAVTEVATILAIALVLLVYEPAPTVATMAYFGLLGWGFQKLLKYRTRRLGSTYQSADRDAYVTAEQSLGGLREIILSHVQPSFVQRFESTKLRVAKSRRGMMFLGDAPRSVLEIALVLGIGLLVLTTVSTDTPNESLAALGLFIAAGFRLLPSLSRLVAGVNHFRTGLADLEMLAREFEQTPQIEPIDTTSLLERPLSKALSFEQVSFRYPSRAELVLEKLTCSIPAGQSVAIVGSSGAGKSTLVSLLLGLQNPASGSIFVDGVPIGECLRTWQSVIGLVPQEVYLLDDSLRQNIAFGTSEDGIDEDALHRCVEQAQLEDLVSDLPDGLETVVGERGMWLSGGQRQRVGIARALYRQPSVLVLDEATSSLDTHTEQLITRTIESLYGQLTVLVIAHRLSTVKRCDRVLFLSEGRLTGDDTFDQLRASNAEFAELVRHADLATTET